jgi:Zinc finger, C2H2 type
VRTSIVECDLTALCLQYLTFECFDQYVSQEKLADYAIKGYFAFQDYAIANWSHHFCAMVKAGQHLFPVQPDAEDAIKQLEDALDYFVSIYEDVFQGKAVNPSEKACEAFKQRNSYRSLQSVWSHVYRHQEKGFEARDDVSLKALSKALIRNRKLLEELKPSVNSIFSGKNDLNTFYGDKRYKCPKLTCFHFHEGFKDAESRLLHINRHDRPFRCTFPDCSIAEFGFGSSKDLDKHTKTFHPEVDHQAVTFAVANTVPAQKRPWACHMCDKRFTRNLHLLSHIRNHNAERPFACSECGKAFTRANDCKRHEKIHARR